jgi:hypothetical protein
MKKPFALALALSLALAGGPARAQMPTGAASGATGQVSVGTGAATLIAASRSGGIGVSRASITIVNNTGSDKLCIGFSSAVTPTTGQCLAAIAGAAITLSTTSAIYGAVATTAQTVSFSELY